MELFQHSAGLCRARGQWNSCGTLRYCFAAVGGESPAIHCHIACGQWAAELMQCTTTLARGVRRRESYKQCGGVLQEFGHPLPPGSVALFCKSPVAQSPQAVWRCVPKLLVPNTPRQGGSMLEALHCPSPNVVVYCRGVKGRETRATQCGTISGQSAVELIQHTSHGGAVAPVTPSTHCHSASG